MNQGWKCNPILEFIFSDTVYLLLGRSDDSSEAEDVSVLQRRIRMYKGQVSTMKLEVERLKVIKILMKNIICSSEIFNTNI